MVKSWAGAKDGRVLGVSYTPKRNLIRLRARNTGWYLVGVGTWSVRGLYLVDIQGFPTLNEPEEVQSLFAMQAIVEKNQPQPSHASHCREESASACRRSVSAYLVAIVGAMEQQGWRTAACRIGFCSVNTRVLADRVDDWTCQRCCRRSGSLNTSPVQ